MADDRLELEGSALRAQDRGANLLDAIEVQQDSLNDPEVVDAVLRSFGTVVAGAWATWVESEGDVDPTAAIDQAATAYADKFFGKDPELVATSWNTPDRLGRYLASSFKTPVAPADAPKTALLTLADRLLTAQRAYNDGTADDQQTEFEVDAAFEDATKMMLGSFIPEAVEIP